MLNFQYGAFPVSSEHVSRIILHAAKYMELKKMSKNPVREVVKVCRNHVVLLENKCIARVDIHWLKHALEMRRSNHVLTFKF